MEPTTLVYGVLLALGLLLTDAAVRSDSVVVEVTAPSQTEAFNVNEAALESQFSNLIDGLLATRSVVRPPEVVWSREQGVGMALAKSLDLEDAAYALRSELGYKLDRFHLSFYVYDNKLHALVSGNTDHGVNFAEVFIPNEGEEFMAFMRRCTLWGVSQIAPYSTAVYLLKEHSFDRDFSGVVALAEHTKALLPPTPTSLDRSLFDNLLGLVALFKHDIQGARAAFAAAMAADPSNPVPFINAAFVDLQRNEYAKAARQMEQLIRLAPPENKVLLASAYMTWGAAMMGLREFDGADRALAAAAQINPDSSTTFGLWAEAKRLKGDREVAERLVRRAQENSAVFENYAEVAALYFRLAWEDDKPVELNTFSNPGIVSFH